MCTIVVTEQFALIIFCLTLQARPAFFNLFFKAEPFAAILIAHGTLGHSQKLVSGGTVKFQAEC